MKYKNLADMHTHSKHSFDGHNTCADLCSSAYEKGAFAIAITDHCDIDGKYVKPDTLCPKCLSDLTECQNMFKGKIRVIKGIEIGQGIYRKKETESLLEKYDYDFALGSLHNLENRQDFYFLDYKNLDVTALLREYFSGLIDLCRWGAFDSLAHLTYPLRYIVAREKIDVDMTAFSDMTDEILTLLAENEKALEINTSGLFMDISDTLPNISFVKRFKELGGKYVTIGSDSHYADKVCQGIEQGMDIARESGFEYITIFDAHQPVLIPIE